MVDMSKTGICNVLTSVITLTFFTVLSDDPTKSVTKKFLGKMVEKLPKKFAPCRKKT
jgi:hypothetical protein